MPHLKKLFANESIGAYSRTYGKLNHCDKGYDSVKISYTNECEGEVAFFSAKHWDRRNRANLNESANPCHDAPVVVPNGTRTHST